MANYVSGLEQQSSVRKITVAGIERAPELKEFPRAK